MRPSEQEIPITPLQIKIKAPFHAENISLNPGFLEPVHNFIITHVDQIVESSC